MLRRSWLGGLVCVALALGFTAGWVARTHAAASDIVFYTSDVTTVRGNWARVASTSAAGGQTMSSADYGWSTPDAPLVSPADFFEATFTAPSTTTYQVW